MSSNPNDKNLSPDQSVRIEKSIACWEEAVSWIEKGWDGEDEYVSDVSTRHTVFKLLEVSNESLPAALQVRLDAADARYRAATVDDWPFASCRHFSELDQQQHWYWFRRPEEASMRKAWENDPEFRRFYQAAVPVIDTTNGGE
jgi:hypothetical protein